MLDNKLIAVVVPAYNEEKQIKMVLDTMPDFVDRIVVVNDLSTDATEDIVLNEIKKGKSAAFPIKELSYNSVRNKYNEAEIVFNQVRKDEIKRYTPFKIANDNPDQDRIILINHIQNGGVGAAIASGYRWCRDHSIDCTAVMAGDGQMDPAELESICKPVIQEGIDYVKGNRLIHRSAWLVIPKIRYFGNSILSLITKIASGYWHVSDTQTGYTAISLKALNSIRLYDIYKRYGMPNDMLVKLNIAFCTIREIEIKPIYRVGEQSKMKISKVIPKISWLLFKSFFYRLWVKYFFRDFHPLFLLYNMGFVLFLINIPLFLYVFKKTIIDWGSLQIGFYMAFVLVSISSFQSIFFAMWMDIQDNERLYR